MRVATWNLAYHGPRAAADLGALVRHTGIDILLLQEANTRALPALTRAAGLDWSITAYDAGAPGPVGTRRPRVTAIAGRGSPPTRIGYLPELMLPEKMVSARLHLDIGNITVASYHAPPGVMVGRVKVDHALALLDWVNATPDPIVVGADANTPEIDHPSRNRVKTHWHTGIAALHGGIGDDVMFGGHPSHRLHDALRRWLEQHPDELARRTLSDPDGPLAISHRTGRRANSPGTPRRFDALWVSPGLAIEKIDYNYDGAIAAGSDHALVTATLAADAHRQSGAK